MKIELPVKRQVKKRLAYFLANLLILYGSPNGTRTRVAGVRGRYPRPLDDGTIWLGDEDSNLG